MPRPEEGEWKPFPRWREKQGSRPHTSGLSSVGQGCGAVLVLWVLLEAVKGFGNLFPVMISHFSSFVLNQVVVRKGQSGLTESGGVT